MINNKISTSPFFLINHKMTELEPIFISLVSHLHSILSDPYLQPNDTLFDEIRLNLVSKPANTHDLTLLKTLGEPILQIIHSNDTTMQQKAAAVEVLVQLLPLYTFEDVLNTFGEPPIIDAILKGRQHDLQKAVVKLLTKVDNPDASISNGIIEALFVAVSDPMVYYGVFDELHKVVIRLAKYSANFREELVTNQRINDNLLKMKQDGILQSRLTDLAIDLIPYVPDLDKSLYLISERELLSSNDPLLFAFTIQAYFKLLEHQFQFGSLQFLENEMDEQFNYCSKLFVDPEFGEYIKTETNADYPELLGQLSKTFPKKYAEVDVKYHILDYALDHIKSKSSIRFLSTVDPMNLYDKDDFFYNLNLNSDTLPVFYNLVSNEKVFTDKLDLEHFPISKINLTFTKLVWLVELMIQYKYILKRLTNEWSTLAMTIIKPINPIADYDLQQQRKNIIEAILNSGFELSPDLLKNLEEQVELVRKGVYVMEPLTETS